MAKNIIILGKPNAGKSSLLNAFLGKQVAVVNNFEGLTRDLKAIELKSKYPESVINSYCPITKNEDPNNRNIPKVVMKENQDLIYISRAKIPQSKNDNDAEQIYNKQVCIYSFPYDALQKFGKKRKKSKIEIIEDIEILRFIEMGIKVKMFEVKQSTIGVDTIEDLKRVEKIIKNNEKI